MELGLEGRVAVVAAASSGLGLASAAALAAEGALVAIAARDRGRLEAASQEIEKEARRLSGDRFPRRPVLTVPCDLSTVEGPARFVLEAQDAFGRVDIVVANCGGPAWRKAVEVGDEDWAQAIPLTLLSTTRLIQAALPGMRARRWGRVIAITSVSVKQPIEGLVLSTALRSAVVGYLKSLSDEVASEGITVNAIAPGSIATPRLESLLLSRARDEKRDVEAVRTEVAAKIPARRLGRPEELGAAVAFLASARAAYITGTVFPIDGGVIRSVNG